MLDRPRLAEKAQIHPVDDGYMIYDPDQDRVHYLNVTAALSRSLATVRSPLRRSPVASSSSTT